MNLSVAISLIASNAQSLTVIPPTMKKSFMAFLKGSVLGPLLFLLYINDIQNCNMDANIKFVLYADDTNVFIASDTIEKCIEKANYVLARIQKYMSSNLLHINLDKCCLHVV